MIQNVDVIVNISNLFTLTEPSFWISSTMIWLQKLWCFLSLTKQNCTVTSEISRETISFTQAFRRHDKYNRQVWQNQEWQSLRPIYAELGGIAFGRVEKITFLSSRPVYMRRGEISCILSIKIKRGRICNPGNVCCTLKWGLNSSLLRVAEKQPAFIRTLESEIKVIVQQMSWNMSPWHAPPPNLCFNVLKWLVIVPASPITYSSVTTILQFDSILVYQSFTLYAFIPPGFANV